MTEETTTEQLAEIEAQATEYTPPEGWRVLRYGEVLQPGDMWVWPTDDQLRQTLHAGAVVGANQRYIRRIEPQPEPETTTEQLADTSGRDIVRGLVLQVADLIEREEPQPEPQPEPVPEPDAELRIRLLKQANDSQAETIGRLLTEARDLNMEIGGLERQLLQRDARIRDLEAIYSAATKSFEDANKANDALRAQVRILQREAHKKNSRIEFLETLDAGNAVAIVDYRAQVEKLQGLVDTARGQLETAATEHDSLSTQLAAVKAELVTQAETSRRLQIELDAAQQVPQAIADRFEEGWNQGTARAVETVIAWLEPIRLADSAYLANATMQHLPQIMRHLTGLAQD